MPTEPPLSDTEKRAIMGLANMSRELRTMHQQLVSYKRRKPRAPRARLPRCPKCNAHPTIYVELWHNHTITFGTDASGQPEPDGNMQEGSPYGVEATCTCGHRWRLTRVTQITDLHDLV